VSVQEHVHRLIAARLQADIMGVETVLVARTDAESATFLDNNVDPRDHPFIIGATNPDIPILNDELRRAQQQGASPDAVADLQSKWDKNAGLMTYFEAVKRAILSSKKPESETQDLLKKWTLANAFSKDGVSNSQQRQIARSLGFDPFWCWEKPRTNEGYYRVQGGVEYCIVRSVAFAPYSDMLWMETKNPHLQETLLFAREVRTRIGGEAGRRQLFAYNLSPSFNWDAAGMNDKQIAEFTDQLGKAGFVWQFITLAGFHSDALGITTFARAFAKDKMLAYVRMIQRQERAHKVSTLTHQKWSGAELIDTQIKTVTGGLASTSSMQSGNTEAQFTSTKKPVSVKRPTEEDFDTVMS